MKLAPGLLFALLTSSSLGCTGNVGASHSAQVAWVWEQPERGAIVATPLVTTDRIYLNCILDEAAGPRGAVTCLDRATRQVVWRFDDGGKMLHGFSSPCLWQDRLYVGEGMHGNFNSKLYCLDANSGAKLWSVETRGHVESSPCVSAGRVFACAGDDGLLCWDATTGSEIWHFANDLHLDSNPLVVGDSVFIGSGISKRLARTEVLCLNAVNGSVRWRLPVDLPAWGSPFHEAGEVFFGLGNGRLDKSVSLPEAPAGALLCVGAAKGEERWRYRVSDGVLAQPKADAHRVYFGCRDGRVHAVDRRTHERSWVRELGSAVVASPSLLDDLVVAISTEGRLAFLDAKTGKPQAMMELAAKAGTRLQAFASPVSLPGKAGGTFVAASARGPFASAAVLYCVDQSP